MISRNNFQVIQKIWKTPQCALWNRSFLVFSTLWKIFRENNLYWSMYISWFHEISSKISWKAAISTLFSTNFLRTFSQILLFRNWTIVDWTRFHGWTWSYSWPTSQWKSWRCCEICKSFWNKTQNGQDNLIWWIQFWPTCLKKAKTRGTSKHVRLFRKTGWDRRENTLNRKTF